MDCITFDIGDTVFQFVNGEMSLWVNGTGHEPDATIPIHIMSGMLSAASLLKDA